MAWSYTSTQSKSKVARGRSIQRRRNSRPSLEFLEDRITLTADVWTGASSNLWSDAGNWTLGTPTTGQDLDFPANATNKTSVYDSGLGLSSFGTITIDSGGYDISESFAGSLTLTGGISATYGSSISNFDIDFDPGNGTVSVGAGATLELGGVISGTSGLGVSGGGTLQLGGTSSNIYTGTTTVANATTLVLDKSSAAAVPGHLSISAGGTVQLAQSDQIADASSVTADSGATLNLNNFSDTLSTLNLTGATVATGSGTLTLGGDVTTNASAIISVISGNLDLGGATRTFNIGNNSNTDPDLSITANISGTGAGIIKAGANSALGLSGNNTYDGTTSLNEGAIELFSANALGATSGDTTVASGTSLAVVGGITLAAEPITISGAGFGGLGAIFGANGTNTITGLITLASASRIGVLSGELAISGQITDGASSFTLTKVQSGKLTLTNANPYNGGTTISGGTIAVSNSGALGTGSVTVSSGAELDLFGGVSFPNDIALRGTGVGGNGALRSVSGNNSLSGTVSFTSDVTVNVAGATTLAVSGSVGSGSFVLFQEGSGTLNLTGTNPVVGLFVSSGTMLINGTSLAATNGTNVSSGATLGGSGTAGVVKIRNGGTLAPGNSSPGVLNTGDVNSDNGSILSVQLNGTTGGTQYDQLNVVGAVNLSNPTLTLSLGYAPVIGDSFTIINNDGTDNVTGTFNGLAEGASFTSGIATYRVSYTGGTGNDVTLTVVAITYTWTGLGGDINWSTAANWDTNHAPSGGEDLVFPSGAARLSNTNDLSGKTFSSIEFDGGNYGINGNAITLTNGVSYTSSTGTSEFQADIVLTSTETVDVVAGGDLILSGAISGSGFGITKTGGGTLEYTGFSANNYTGTTTVNAGMLILNRSSGLNAIAGNLVIGDNIGGGETVQIGSNNQIANSAAVTVGEAATFSLNDFDDAIGSLGLNGSTVSTGTGILTLGGNVTVGSSTTTSVITGKLDLGNASRSFDIADVLNVDDELNITAVISGSVGIDKIGLGVLTLGGTNTYLGTTNVISGAIRAENSSALGTTDGSTNVSSGASVFFFGNNLLFNENFVTQGTGVGSAGVLDVVGGSTTLAGSLSMPNGDSEIHSEGNLTINGVIDDGGESYSPNYTAGSSAHITINGDNTYTQNTAIRSGRVRVTSPNAFGLSSLNSTVSVLSGASLEVAGDITLPASKTIAISGVPVQDGSKIINVSGNNTIQGDIAITGGNNVAFDVAGGTSLEVSGTISGSRDFDKNGTGTLILSGSNTNTGNVNVGDGTLLVNGSLASSNSVFVDGILGGSGTVPSVTVSGIGTIAPGNSPGVLSSGNVDFSPAPAS